MKFGGDRGKTDIAAIEIGDAEGTSNWVYGGNNNQQRAIREMGDVRKDVVGQIVCQLGYTREGARCGELTDRDWTTHIENTKVKDVRAADIDSNLGDSGGPVILTNKNRAMGLVHGRSKSFGQEDRMTYTHIAHGLNQINAISGLGIALNLS